MRVVIPALVSCVVTFGASLSAQPTSSTPARSAALPAGWEPHHPDAIIQQMQRAVAGNPATASRQISAVLLHGAEPRVAAFGLHSLAAMARPEGSDVVLRFLEHRRPGLRRHAVAAAVAIGGRSMTRALERRLGDPDPDVRGDAATGLGEIGDANSLTQLWLAFERDLESSLHAEGSALLRAAARSIARIGYGTDVDRLIGYLRRAPFRTLTDAFLVTLQRDAINPQLKLRVVNAIGNLATPEAREFLNQFVHNHRGRPNAYVDAARTAASRIQ